MNMLSLLAAHEAEMEKLAFISMVARRGVQHGVRGAMRAPMPRTQSPLPPSTLPNATQATPSVPARAATPPPIPNTHAATPPPIPNTHAAQPPPIPAAPQTKTWLPSTGKAGLALQAASYIPVAGSVIDGINAIDDFRHGRIGSGIANTIYAGLGFIPGLGTLGKGITKGIGGLFRAGRAAKQAVNASKAVGAAAKTAPKFYHTLIGDAAVTAVAAPVVESIRHFGPNYENAAAGAAGTAAGATAGTVPPSAAMGAPAPGGSTGGGGASGGWGNPAPSNFSVSTTSAYGNNPNSNLGMMYDTMLQQMQP